MARISQLIEPLGEFIVHVVFSKPFLVIDFASAEQTRLSESRPKLKQSGKHSDS
ncbi:hypothetical protein D3C84_1097620 [compost metagenome]